MFSVTVVFAAVGVIRWWSRPGEELFLVALVLSAVFLWLDVRSFRPRRESDSAWDACAKTYGGENPGQTAHETELSEPFGGECWR